MGSSVQTLAPSLFLSMLFSFPGERNKSGSVPALRARKKMQWEEISARKKCRGKKNRQLRARAGGETASVPGARADGWAGKRVAETVGVPDADRFQHLSAPHWPTCPLGLPDADRIHTRLWAHQIRGYSMPAFDLSLGDQRKPATKIRT